MFENKTEEQAKKEMGQCCNTIPWNVNDALTIFSQIILS